MTRLAIEDEIALKIFGSISENWSFSSPIFADAFKREGLSEPQREEIVATVRGMLAQLRRLDFAVAAAGISSKDKRYPYALLLALKILSRQVSPEDAEQFMRGPDWNCVEHIDARIAKIEDPLERFALAHSLPDALARRILDDYPDDSPQLADALNKTAPTCLRANALKTTREELQALLVAEGINVRPAELSAQGLVVDNPGRIFSTQAFHDGLFEVQDEGSQLIAELAEPARGSQVLDMCAGAGGKTLALSALMGGTGSVVALDTSQRKLEELRRRARRAGAYNVRGLQSTADALPDEIAGRRKFARVLVDAPCGGSGALRRNPEARWRGNTALSEGLPDLQEKLLRRAFDACSDRGRVIYATCSLLNVENEAVVEKILAEGHECVPVKLILGKPRAERLATRCGRFMKLLPHKHGTDGFFAAVLRPRR